MLRALRYVLLAVLAIALVAVASANRASVTLRLLPPEMDAFFALNRSVEMPLFLVIFASILAGLGIGFVWEWLRAANVREEASLHKQKASHLEREVSRLRQAKAAPGDDVLALLDTKEPGR